MYWVWTIYSLLHNGYLELFFNPSKDQDSKNGN